MAIRDNGDESDFSVEKSNNSDKVMILLKKKKKKSKKKTMLLWTFFSLFLSLFIFF